MTTAGFTDWLAAMIGAEPRQIEMYQRAFSHGSSGRADYQRLEFLGDRVLGLAIATLLYERFPDEPEGRLSARLNALVTGAACAAIAREHGFASHILLGKQARDDGAANSDNVLGDVMEAMLGAVYLDHGLDVAAPLIARLWEARVAADAEAPKHPKSALQEWAAVHQRSAPEYVVTGQDGPPHNRSFTVAVRIKGFEPLTASGASKQEAEARAAVLFLEAHA